MRPLHLLLLTTFVYLTGAHAVCSQSMISVQIGSSNGDAEENKSNGSVNLTSSDLELCVEDNFWPIPDVNQLVGIWFAPVNVPKGAIIDSAWIQFTVNETNSNPCSVEIYAENGNNAQPFYTLPNNISARSRTTEVVYWDIPNWSSTNENGSAQATPNLKLLVQKVVNRSGWNSGNALAFIFDGIGTRTAYAYDGDASKAPVLHVQWSAVASAELLNDYSIKIYPNPVSHVLYAEGVSQTTSWVLLNAVGQLVMQGMGEDKMQIPVSQLLNGLYFLKINEITTKIIVNH